MTDYVGVKTGIVAQNTFTDWTKVKGKSNLSISGVTDSTVTLQRRHYGGSAVDVDSFTADFEGIIDGSDSDTEYRVGIKTGDYGTDTVNVRISP